jgi:phosphatidate cytidylyltransferase
MAVRWADRFDDSLRVRALSAAALGPIVLLAAYVGGYAFDVTLAVMAWVSIWEWIRLVAPNCRVSISLLTQASLFTVLIVARFGGPEFALASLVVLGAGLWFAAALTQQPHGRSVTAGLPYVALACIAFLWLRHQAAGGQWLTVWILIVVWATDVGGYVVGRSVGGYRLAPRISPNKTWSGLCGGVAAATLAAVIVAMVAGAQSPAIAAGLGAVCALIAQGGDLLESAVKRHYGAKDSGGLIPGHGGMLDRVDGVMAAVPVLAVFHATVGGALGWW